MIERGVYARLAASDVGVAVGGRISPLKALDTDALPYVTYYRIDTQRVHDLQGPAGVCNPRIQVDCWADNYDAAKELADGVRELFDGWSGTAAGYEVLKARVTDDNDLYTPPKDASDVGIYRTSVDVLLWFRE